jgi:hypothetical protein
MANIEDIRRVAAAKERPKAALTKPRILAVLAVLVVVVVVWVVNRERFEFNEVPSSLIGLWTTDDQEMSDQFVEFRPQTVRLGTGGTSDVRFKVLGLNAETIGGVGHLTLHYRDLAGTPHVMEMLLDEAGEELRFMDHPGVVWTRLKR